MKNNTSLDNIIWNFINLKENVSPSIHSFLQAMTETLAGLRPSRTSDIRRIEMAKSQLREIKRHVNKLEEQVFVLEEQVKLLEETKDKDIVKEEG